MINFTDLNGQSHEKEMIQNYSKFVQEIVGKKIQEDSTIQINDRLQNLIERCNQEENMPTFEDFIDFFKNDSYRSSYRLNENIKCQRYFQILNFEDTIIYDDLISQRHNNCENFDSIEQICYYFYNNRKEIKELSQAQKFMLNSLPDFYIKQMVKFCSPLTEKLKRYLYNDDLSQVIPNWNKLDKSNSFQLYKFLMKQITDFENQINEIDYFNKKVEEIEYKIEAIRIKAIQLLKDAFKQSENPNVKIELAVQYIKGELLPYNLTKALKILKSISTSDSKTKRLIGQMKEKVNAAININLTQEIPDVHIKKFEKAEKNDILSMLYIAFSLFTGFDGFPILRSFSIQYYRKAAKLSPDAMTILGFLYLNGIFFPRNLKRAKNCFKKATEKGCSKAEIVDCMLRKHIWRTYLLDFDINDLFKNFLPPFCYKTWFHSYAFPQVNYLLGNVPSLRNQSLKILIELKLQDFSQELKSENEIHGMNIIQERETIWDKKFKPVFTEKILLNSDKKEDPLKVGKSYYYGLNNYPVNYIEAVRLIKISADNGNSEAQWRFALLCLYSIGFNCDTKVIRSYLKKSTEQNNIQGKFYYTVLTMDKEIFDTFMKDCINNEHLDAMYYYGIYLEKNGNDIENVIKYYKNASEKGHIDSFLRLLNIYENQSEKELFENSLNLSVGFLNETTLLKLIKIFDNDENYKQSNILIQVGIKLNHEIFDYYYFDHLLYGKGITANIKRAKKLIILAIREYEPQLIPDKYIYLMLQAYAINNEHEKALGFLLKFEDRITEDYKDDFHLFYQHFDRNMSRLYFIPECFYYKDFKECHKYYMECYIQNNNFVQFFTKLKDKNNKPIEANPFALAIIGKAYKQGKPFTRDLREAVKYFEFSAMKKCPLGYYYIAKEFYYGRYIKQDYEEALKYFRLAIKNNDVPRAGYYIFKISTILKIESDEDVKMLEIGVKFGHKKALFKYGHRLFLGTDSRIPQDKQKGIELIQQSSYQKYSKAIKFCLLHDVSFRENKIDSDSSMDEDDSNLELPLSSLLSDKEKENSDNLINQQKDETSSVNCENDVESNDEQHDEVNMEESNNEESNNDLIKTQILIEKINDKK